MDKKTQAVIYGLDDASPLELEKALAIRKNMWRGLKFKLNLIIILLAANLLATLSIDIITWISTDLFNMLIALWNNSIDLFKSLLQ